MTSKIKILFLISFLVVILHFAYVISIYNSLPDTIAIHFDTLGNPDGYGDKKFALVIPAINLLITFIMWGIAKNPNFANSMRANKMSDEEFAKNQNLSAIMTVSVTLTFFVLQFLTL